MPGKRAKITAEQANNTGLVCNNGHTGQWLDSNWGRNGALTRHCVQCDRDRARAGIYGLTPSAYAQLKAEHPVCAICQHDGALRGLEIDHDHISGEVRGLLCRACNIALGHFELKRHLLPAMEAYLRAGQA